MPSNRDTNSNTDGDPSVVDDDPRKQGPDARSPLSGLYISGRQIEISDIMTFGGLGLACTGAALIGLGPALIAIGLSFFVVGVQMGLG